MNILLVTETLLTGGAEIFIMRMAQAMKKRGHNVLIYNFYKKQHISEQSHNYAPDVRIIEPDLPINDLLFKVDRLFYKLSIDANIRLKMIEKHLRRVIIEEKIDVVHSHLFPCDLVTCRAIEGMKGVNHVTTIHGDYIQYPKMLENKQDIFYHGYWKKLKYILSRLNNIVVISEEQKKFFLDERENHNGNFRLYKIYNGITVGDVRHKPDLKKDLGIANNDKVFGMVGRGIKEKGWEECIQSFIMAALPDSHLILIGKSDHLEYLKDKYGRQNIHFVGFSKKPLEWIDIMDVGIFTSYFPGESLPTALIEYVTMGKPAISTDIAECRQMLEENGEFPGFCIPLVERRPNVEAIAKAMRVLYEDEKLYERCALAATRVKKRFDMDTCIDAYVSVYEQSAKASQYLTS